MADYNLLPSNKLSALFTARHDVLTENDTAQNRPYDLVLVLIALTLFAIGFVIVTSASMPIAERLHGNPFHFAIRHAIYIGLALIAAMIVLNLPMNFWRVANPYLLLVAIVLLIAVLIIGRTVNGSTRWIVIGPITIQAAEPAKLFFICYLANQPDLGTVIVMFATTIGLLFLAGAKLWQFFGLVFTGVLAVVALILFEPYRVKRVTAFLDPWADPFGSGYQLTQSLMAYGRGSWFGQGLGNSLQKLEFLPEAHTDFIMAILAEEFGYIGVLVVLFLIFSMVVIALRIGNKAMKQDRPFDAFLAYGIGIWFSFQTVVNVGASTGILPTKGLTLPLVSYGGSSLIVMAIAVAILLRIDFELRVEGVQALKRSRSGKKTNNKVNRVKIEQAKASSTPEVADDV
jgi:cell division protein FtsW